MSKRVDKPFIPINCAAMPETLLESILFGTLKGAFTGSENRKGMFEIADGGTIFLDELSSMSLNTQAKLLRAIEEKQILKLGDTKIINSNVRILAAMNESPEEAIVNGHLRKDLYYRLSECSINIPPIRERKEDIPLLVNFFINKYSKEINSNVTSINPQMMSKLMEYNSGQCKDDKKCYP